MKRRCHNENDPSYRYYGGKGITVCDEWLNDFSKFWEWARANGYEGPKEEHYVGRRMYRDVLTIDRIDSDKGYEPSNCRFITFDENRRRRKKKELSATR